MKIFASHKESVTSEKEIYFLVETHDNGELKVLHWGVPRSIACIPKDLVEGSEVEKSFNIKSEYKHEVCTNAQWYQ